MALCYVISRSLRSTHQPLIVAASHLGHIRLVNTASYLISSCGLSPEAATLASHKVTLQSLDKPNSVLALLREYEFSLTQISTIVLKRPNTLLANPDKILLPKLEFFCSLGISRSDLARVLTSNPALFHRSLEKSIRPFYVFLKTVVLSDVRVLLILKRNPYVFEKDVKVKSNIILVKELGMPPPALTRLICTWVVLRRPDFFSRLVRQVQEMGFDLRNGNFLQAMIALSAKKTVWRLKEEAYKKWGWSDGVIISAFKRYPLCMTPSGKKIMAVMDFLVNMMGFKSGEIAKCPYIVLHSLEKRIIPRGSVVRVLLMKGLIEKETLSLSSVFTTLEEYFLNRFVMEYLDQVPQLMNIYRGSVCVQDVCSC